MGRTEGKKKGHEETQGKPHRLGPQSQDPGSLGDREREGESGKGRGKEEDGVPGAEDSREAPRESQWLVCEGQAGPFFCFESGSQVAQASPELFLPTPSTYPSRAEQFENPGGDWTLWSVLHSEPAAPRVPGHLLSTTCMHTEGSFSF